MREKTALALPQLQANARALAELDVLSSLAELADRRQYCRPNLVDDDRLLISQGRHPVVEQSIKEKTFVPNDTLMDGEERQIMILTGPNMAGKSTYMRQVALIVLLAQMGSFVPAASATIGLVDRIFTRVGASDDLGSGQSTFMVEMNEVAHILKHATPKSLLLLDEVGRGTSTYDGLSIAWSVTEYLADEKRLGGCRTLFATHYHELTDLAGLIRGVFNCHVAVEQEGRSISFLHQIQDGGTNDSFGIEVAKLAGVPDTVVDRAHEILMQLERDNKGKRLTVRRSARPMDGQLDLFSAAQSVKDADKLLSEIGNIDIDQLRPVDALNLLADLKVRAAQAQARQAPK